MHFVLFILSLFFSLNLAAQSLCGQSFFLTQNRVELDDGGVGGPRPENPMGINGGFSKAEVQFRKAYNRGFFKADERYIVIGGRGLAYIKSVQKGFLLVEEMDIDGNLIESRLSVCTFCSVNSSVKNIFKSLALDSRFKVVESATYPQFDKEAQAAKKGFKKEMFQGLDEAYKMAYLVGHLRRSKAHPYKTHIEDFSNQISEHIHFIREGIRKGGNETTEKLKTLDKLALEAEKKQKEKQVTYAWWIKWNGQLINLLSVQSDSHLQTENENHINFLVQFFPDFVVLPTLKYFGIMAMNKFASENISPLGLVDRTTFADGAEWTPYKFFNHDITHARSILRNYIENNNFLYGKNSSIANKEFYDRIQELPIDQQMQVEIVYFLTTHEESRLYDVYSYLVFESYLQRSKLWNVLPADVRRSHKETDLYLKEARRVYKKLLREDKLWLRGWPVF